VTTPHEEQPAAAAQASPQHAAAGVPGTPQVTTAPPRARWRLGRVPARLGRARTSTVVLAVVWLLVALLWLDVRPPPAQVTPAGGSGTATTPAPATTRPPEAPRSSAPATTVPPTTPERTATTAPEPTAATPAPASTTPGATRGTPAPTTAVPGTGGTVGTPGPTTSGAAPTG
jgi:hypothetical protein